MLGTFQVKSVAVDVSDACPEYLDQYQNPQQCRALFLIPQHTHNEADQSGNYKYDSMFESPTH